MMFATACDELEGGCQRAQSTAHQASVASCMKSVGSQLLCQLYAISS